MNGCVIDWPLLVNGLGALATLVVGGVAWHVAKTVRDDSRARGERAARAACYLAEGELGGLKHRARFAAQALRDLQSGGASAVGQQQAVIASFPSFAVSDFLTQSLLVGDFPRTAIDTVTEVINHAAEVQQYSSGLQELVVPNDPSLMDGHFAASFENLAGNLLVLQHMIEDALPILTKARPA